MNSIPMTFVYDDDDVSDTSFLIFCNNYSCSGLLCCVIPLLHPKTFWTIYHHVLINSSRDLFSHFLYIDWFGSKITRFPINQRYGPNLIRLINTRSDHFYGFRSILCDCRTIIGSRPILTLFLYSKLKYHHSKSL